MKLKACLAALCAAAVAASTIAVAPASSQTRKKRYVYTTTVRTGARSRIVVVPRSFLDAGTEVLPGERKFTDYAFPPTYTPLGVITNVGGRVGWHNSPLPGPFDLPSRRNPYGW